MAGIYIHVPFCKQKCTYCDFCSYPKELDKKEAYFACLYREIKGRGMQLQGKTFDTVYFGGGTPSIVPPEYIAGAMKQIRNFFTLSSDPEITIEMNPGTVDENKIKVYKEVGINRFSIGLQTGFDDQLKRLNRIHTARDFVHCTELLKGENFSADVLIGLHDQTYDNVKRTVDLALACGAKHISAYALTPEEGTPVYTDYLNGELLSDDEVADIYSKLVGYLKEKGLNRYEVSNFAFPGYESRHNMTYWTRGDYIGMGASASSLIGNRRFTNVKKLDEYMNMIIAGKNPEAASETLTVEDEMFETVMLGLRLEKGFSLKKFKDDFGIDFKEYFKDSYEKNKDFLVEKDGFLAVKPEYMYVENGIIVDFMKE